MLRRFDPAQPELMDIVGSVTPELESDLENLRLLNRWFGSHRLIRHYLPDLLPAGGSYRLLDLCTGSGDIPRLIVDWGKQHGRGISIDAVDFQAATLDVARRRSANYPSIRFIEGDARDFDPGELYDGVLCSLALHHFSESDAVGILTNMRRLSKGFILAADLERSWLTSAGVWFITATVFRQPMTVYDGRMSAARAFSHAELSRLATAAGWSAFQHRRFLYGRQALVETGLGQRF